LFNNKSHIYIQQGTAFVTAQIVTSFKQNI